MKKNLIGIASALLVVSFAATTHAWVFDAEVHNDFGNKNNQRYDNSSHQKIGGSAYQNSNNRTITNRNDNRQFNDNRDMSDNRTTIDSHNTTDNSTTISNQRHQSHNLGNNSILLQGGYQPRVGHSAAHIGSVSGSNNYVDNSSSGYFGIGHQNTTVKGAQ